MPNHRYSKLDSYLYSIRDIRPYVKGVLPQNKLIEFNEPNLARLSIVQRYTRGFDLRHWKLLSGEMARNRFSEDFQNTILISFLKFKLLAALRPQMRGTLIWIFKNLLVVEDQKFYRQIKDFYYDQNKEYGMEEAMRAVYESRGEWDKYTRISRYLEREDDRWFVPSSFFPLVDPNKSLKMPLAFVPYCIDYEKKMLFRSKFSAYLDKLGIEDLFVPPTDILDKIGNNKYNDGGIPRPDHSPPERSFDSKFLYQKFITQPLQIREVWLPGKGIKIANTFWQVVCSQILSRDHRYPDGDIVSMWERIRDRLTGPLVRFDLSGFGFQFPREWLEIGASCICERYPNSILDEMFGILCDILNNVEVTMESGKVERPPRGIGLGYFEALKTLSIFALLDEYNPLSLYGDQGLLSLEVAFEAIQQLSTFCFIVDFEKVEWVGSTTRPTVKWAGASLNEVEVRGIDKFLENLSGAFFQKFHWERKSTLLSVMETSPSLYSQCRKKLIFMYQRIFGHEFSFGEARSHFNNGGINMFRYQIGWDRTYKVGREKVPFDPLLYDSTFVTPFKALLKKSYPMRLAKEFSKKRKLEYRKTRPNWRYLYDYIDPVYRYKNDKPQIGERTLPLWADMLYFALHGKVSGSLTWGLSPPAIRRAYEKYAGDTAPCKTKATGGRTRVTRWSRQEVMDHLQVLEMETLESVSRRDLTKVRRNDLTQDPAWGEDPLYRDTDLNRYSTVQPDKRAASVSLSDLLDTDEIRAHFTKKVRTNMTVGEVTAVRDLGEDFLNLLNQDPPTQEDAGSDFGVEGSEVDFDEVEIDDIMNEYE
jgi:hypothetical protein